MTMLAPDTFREWNSRSGISGFSIRAWRRRTPPPARSTTAREDQRLRRGPAVLARRRGSCTRPASGRRSRARRRGRRRPRRCRCPAGPRRAAARARRSTMPIGTFTKKIQCQLIDVGEDAAGEQADRAARRRHEPVHADRLRLLARLGEHRHDHPERDRRGQRAARALDEPGGDQHLLASAPARTGARRP